MSNQRAVLNNAIDEMTKSLDWESLKHGDFDTLAKLQDLQIKLVRESPKLGSKLDVESKSAPQAKAAREAVRCWEGDMNNMAAAMRDLKAATTMNY